MVKYYRGMTVYIYGLFDPRNGLLRYIGKTNDLKTRHSAHSCEKGDNHKHNWVKSLSRLGLRPVMKVLETIENSDDNDWQIREKYWIASARRFGHPITNLDSGGRGGFLKSEETKAKIREKAIGRKLQPESIEKMRATKRERMTPELRKRLSEINLGRKHSDEVKRARSIALTGRPVSEKTRRKISESNKLAKPRKQRAPYIRSEETRLKMAESRRQYYVRKKALQLSLVSSI